MNKIQQEDIDVFASNFSLNELISDKKFLVTGATGLVGSTLVKCLLSLNVVDKITCPVRNILKARQVFETYSDKIDFIECDLVTYLNDLTSEDAFDYVIHCASPTNGKYMVEHPVETFMLAIETTRAILEHSRVSNPSGVVYISSLEYYGQNEEDNIITEDFQGYISNTDSRSSYPLGKRAAEYLCASYARQFGVNAKVARLTQTFGAGVSPDDNRVFAQFARSILYEKDIILHTKGDSAKPYCYVTDCVEAILFILLKGVPGEAYNVANQDTYISVKDMAEFLRENFNPSINVVVEECPGMGYAPVTKLHLSSTKLMALGWKPRYDLEQMYSRLLDSYRL